jgi:hypothetical protein
VQKPANSRYSFDLFRSLCVVTSCIAFVLSAVFIVVPGIIEVLFDIEAGPSAEFLARRSGVVFLGVSVLTFAARKITDFAARRAISLGMAVMMTGLSVLGSIEFLRGVSGIGTIAAAALEVAIGVGFIVAQSRLSATP